MWEWDEDPGTPEGQVVPDAQRWHEVSKVLVPRCQASSADHGGWICNLRRGHYSAHVALNESISRVICRWWADDLSAPEGM